MSYLPLKMHHKFCNLCCLPHPSADPLTMGALDTHCLPGRAPRWPGKISTRGVRGFVGTPCRFSFTQDFAPVGGMITAPPPVVLYADSVATSLPQSVVQRPHRVFTYELAGFILVFLSKPPNLEATRYSQTLKLQVFP